ncbi:MAG: YjbQ family protein [Planctomycetes bacterium]|nr:YjbQ family protein [Planctomycetota bacterium]
MAQQYQFNVSTPGRGTIDITRQVEQFVRESDIQAGLANVFISHTSASLILCENADAMVRTDLESWLSRAVPDGDRLFRHTMEGPDDMPAHVRSVLTASSISIPIVNGRMALGTWQGLYLYEHRTEPHRRTIRVTMVG